MKSVRMNSCRIGLTVIFYFLLISSFGQRYFPGFVVKLDGDSLRGLIHHEDDSRKIFFKKDKGSDRSVFSPLDIRGFGLREQLFESAIVDTEMSAQNDNDLSEVGDLDIETDTVFLLVLVRGSKSLYSAYNRMVKQQFYIRRDNRNELLIYKKFFKTVNNKKVIAQTRRFTGQLTTYFENSSDLNNQIQKTNYQEKSLQQLFREYYAAHQTSTPPTYIKPMHRIPREFGILGGASLTSMKFKYNGPGLNAMTQLNLNNSTDVTAGIYLGFTFPKNQGRWSVFNELQYTHYSMSDSKEDYVNEESYTNTTFAFEFSYIKLNNMLRYRIPVSKRSSLFFNIGMSNGIAFSETNLRTRNIKFYTTSKEVVDPAIAVTRKYEQAIFFGTGFQISRFSIQLRLEKANGFSNTNNLTAPVTRYFGLLGFRI